MVRRIQIRKLFYFSIVLFVVGISTISLFKLFKPAVSSSAVLSASDSTDAKSVRDSFDIHREFEFSLSKKDKNKKFKMIIQKAQLVDQIEVKGQTVTAISSRTFLMFDMQLVNETDASLAINPREYVRLSVNKNDKDLLAPDIQSDPIEIQGMSMEDTHLGFPVNIKDHDFVLQIGGLNSEGQEIELPFNK